MKTKNWIKRSDKKGSTLVEALISMAIMSYVIVSILSGFSQQQADTQKNTDRNEAVMLAEMRLEELMKVPAEKLMLITPTYQDYVVPTPYGYDSYDENDTPPTQTRQFRRTTEINMTDPINDIVTITVTVDYGPQWSGSHLIFPLNHSVELTTRRCNK